MMDATLFLAQEAPGRIQLLLVTLLPTAISLGLFWILKSRDKSDVLYRFRLVSLIPILIGLILGGLLSVRMATDFLYQQVNLIGRGTQIMHYASFAVPLLGGIAILIWNRLSSQEQKYDF